MYAIIQSGGKQFRVEEGQTLAVDLLQEEIGKSLVFDEVLLVAEDDKVHFGEPFLKGTKIKASYLKEIKDKKIDVFRFKRRKNIRRKTGHRQRYSLVQIDKITLGK